MPRKLSDLVLALAKKTEQGKVSWEKTAEEEVYQVAFPNYTIHLLTRPSDESEGLDYLLRIMDEDGTLIEEVSDVDLGGGGVFFKAMDQMYKSARRRALGVDKALDAIFASLGEDELPMDQGITDDDVPF
jgi:hypothetical protein